MHRISLFREREPAMLNFGMGIPAADPYADDMKAAAIEVPVVSFAMQDREADVYAERVKYSVWETEILIRTPLGKLQV